MTLAPSTGGRSKSLILTAMIFAVAMTFIDQTIVSIAAPTIQHDLGLSSSGMQWAINAYLLTLAALFAFGGRLADTHGHRKMVVLGVIIFAGASALCGADAERRRRRGVAGGVPRTAGRGRGHHVPGRDRHRGGHLRPALAGPGPGVVFRHRRGADRDRPDRRRLPDRMDLAGDLLDQHPGRADRPGADRHLQAGQRIPARADGLPRPGPDHRRGGAERVRVPAVRPVGLGQPGHLGEHRRRRRPPRRVLLRRAPDRIAADQRAHLRQPDVHGGERHLGAGDDGVHPGVLLRQHLRAGRPGREGHHVQPAHLVLLPRFRGLRADRRPDAGPDRGQTAGGARLRAGRGRVRPVGRAR